MTDDENILAMILGGFIGAALAKPNQQDQQMLENYKLFQSQLNNRAQKIPLTPSFISKLGKKPEYYNAFIESYRAYSYGLFRSSVAVASALIESMLKERFDSSFSQAFNEILSKKKPKRKSFYDLIEEAKKERILEESDYHFLHGLRSQRNNSVHDVLKDVSELDSVMILNISIKIIDRLIE
jgi:hypothetical protein